MKKLFVFSVTLLLSHTVSAQTPDTISLEHDESVKVVMEDVHANIQSPSNTYMVEVIDEKGIVTVQNPTSDFISLNTSSWKSGNYTVLAHTFNGLRLAEFRLP